VYWHDHWLPPVFLQWKINIVTNLDNKEGTKEQRQKEGAEHYLQLYSHIHGTQQIGHRCEEDP
jgi:hypothetical protein